MLLRDGSEVEDPRLDRLYELDWRSLDYPVTELLETTSRTKNLRTDFPRVLIWQINGITLDQGPDGACVGFSYAHEMIAEPQVLQTFQDLPVDAKFAKEKLYWEAQKIDEWAGGSYPGATPQYEGTSMLAGAKVLRSLGVYSAYYWALNIRQLILGVSHEGPAIVGTNWYQNMFTPNTSGIVRPGGAVVGGHAYLIRGINNVAYRGRWFPMRQLWDMIDMQRSYFRCRNSWGPNWGGKGGDFLISFADMDRLLNERGDACFPKRAS